MQSAYAALLPRPQPLSLTGNDAADCRQATDPERKERGCTALIARNPRSETAFFRRAQAHQAMHEHPRAIADYTYAIVLDPRYAHAYHNRAAAWQALGALDHAIGDYTVAIALNPVYALAHYGRAAAFEANSERTRAIADYRRALSLDPQYEDARGALQRLGVSP